MAGFINLSDEVVILSTENENFLKLNWEIYKPFQKGQNRAVTNRIWHMGSAEIRDNYYNNIEGQLANKAFSLIAQNKDVDILCITKHWMTSNLSLYSQGNIKNIFEDNRSSELMSVQKR